MSDRLIFCFKPSEVDPQLSASLYREDAADPLRDDPEQADEMIRRAFEALPFPVEEYDRTDAGTGTWVRFDLAGLLTGAHTEPIQTNGGEADG
jgi:hypothetical protein